MKCMDLWDGVFVNVTNEIKLLGHLKEPSLEM